MDNIKNFIETPTELLPTAELPTDHDVIAELDAEADGDPEIRELLEIRNRLALDINAIPENDIDRREETEADYMRVTEQLGVLMLKDTKELP